MHPSEKVKTHRKPTNLSLDNELLREAKALGINVSRSAEAGIEVAVRRQKQLNWLKENAAAVESSNAYVEEKGLPLSKHRWYFDPDQETWYITLSPKINFNRKVTMFDQVIAVIKKLTEAGVSLLALAIVAQIIFGEVVPFIGGDVIGNITAIVDTLGAQGLVGLAAVGVIYAIFNRSS